MPEKERSREKDRERGQSERGERRRKRRTLAMSVHQSGLTGVPQAGEESCLFVEHLLTIWALFYRCIGLHVYTCRVHGSGKEMMVSSWFLNTHVLTHVNRVGLETRLLFMYMCMHVRVCAGTCTCTCTCYIYMHMYMCVCCLNWNVDLEHY